MSARRAAWWRGGASGAPSVLARVAAAQLRMVWAVKDNLLPLASTPLFTVIFLVIVRAAGREDLTGYAVLAPVLITLWAVTIEVAGTIVEAERWYGTIDLTIAAPLPLPVVVLTRIFGVTLLAMLALVEAWLVARVGFGIRVTVHHPLLLALTLGATALAMAGTALAMAAAFVLSRNARMFQNAMSYPFYLLGGVLVPVALLPGWLQPVSRLVFLSWSADLLRDALVAAEPHGVPLRLGAILALAAAGFAAGRLLLDRVLDRARLHGTLSHV